MSTSTHIDVSCDACLKTNFSDRRYKCLLCDNYDLCGSCYDAKAESQNHHHDHSMQCILTKTAYELFYAGESIPHRSVVSLSCPYCSACGFLPRTLLTHCFEQHPMISAENPTKQLVMCPICVILPSQDYQTRFVSLTDHLIREHDSGESISQLRTSDNKREFVDHEDDDDEPTAGDDEEDEDEGVPLNFHAERLILKDETTRRQNYSAALQGQRAAHRRTLAARQTGLRGFRGTATRGHYNPSPYTMISRPNARELGLSFGLPIDPEIFAEFYTGYLHPALSSTLYDPPPDRYTGPPTYIPPVKPPVFQRPTENNDRTNQKRSTLPVPKQKRLCHHPTQSSFHSDSQAWHEHCSSLTTSSIVNDQRLENDARSLIGKILKLSEPSASIERTIEQEWNHQSFFKSLLLSSMNLSLR